ncbi:alcohol oxidase [Delitschia confertaspora ATCC 74209]|uniref:Alcohol oxidase n=1 Tax=Delitschia confertaspora ATCC 74209 TaxID=1513339 RepID=A0A9P4JSF1_9PLEO|nr:alcohol oxidase [Delitschia confertaspora ATCC 74209]
MSEQFSAGRVATIFLTVVGSITPFVSTHPGLAGRGNIVSKAEAVSKKYDFIVVGGGTAGLTVADRLTEDPKTTVLVVEHGYFYDANDPNDLRTSRNYNMTSLPIPSLGGKTVPIVVGHCVGGSSAINGQGVHRSTRRDYGTWAELGGPGSTWNWDGLLPSFKKAVNLQEPDPAYAKYFNITYDIPSAWGQYESSRVLATFSPQFGDNRKTMYNALKRVPGIEVPKDISAGTTGLGWYPITMEPEVPYNRSYSRTGHWDGLNRPNYDIMVGMRVNKVLFNGNKASAVRFVPKEGGAPMTVAARKEIILSAGALHTPQILMLSGIGPEKIIREAGLQVKYDLPGVGQNLQDHPTGPLILFEYGNPPPDKPSPFPLDIFRGQGLQASLSLPVVAPDRFEAIARKYASQDISKYLPSSIHPNVLAGQRAIQKILSREMLGKDIPILNYLVGGPPQAIPIQWKITSRGFVTLNTSNPESDPVVDLRSLSNPVDIDLMIALTRFFRTHFARDLAEWNATEVQPGTNVTTDAQLEEVIKSQYNPVAGHHFVGTTAKMPKQLGGVVDEELFVHGVKGLRVADAGIMPLLPGAATQFTVYSIGEKAAALIKEKWS